jgi:hypothetical protein
VGRLEFRLASRLARRLLVPAGALLVFAALAGCGSGDESASASSDQQRAEKARLDFARCMRQHGVDIPDPTGDRPGEIAIRIKGRADTPQFQRAQKACDKYLQAARPKLSAEDRAKFRDAFVKFSACMRKEGVDLPDPTTSGGGPQRSTSGSGGPGPGSGPSRQAMIGGAKINLDDPRVRKAMDKCRKLLPNGGPGGERRTGGGPGPDLTRSAGG